MSLSALGQQKARTALTTLGVVFGTFVLVVSLSVGQGVQRTIEREARGNVFLRSVNVTPDWAGRKADLREEEVPAPGEMSEDRRPRLREAIIQRKLRFSSAVPRRLLDRPTLQELAGLAHVEAVTPVIYHSGWAIYRKRSRGMMMTSASAGDARLRKRIVAGDLFRTDDERAAVVSEYLCYLLGVTDEAAVAGLVGQTLRLEFRTEPGPSGLALYLVKPDRDSMTREEQVAVEKVREQLPAALDKLKLTAQDRKVLGKALSGRLQAAEVYTEEIVIAGVMRLPTQQEQAESWEWWKNEADVCLPQKTAEEIFFRQRHMAEAGVNHATVLVDREENVRAVVERIGEPRIRLVEAPERQGHYGHPWRQLGIDHCQGGYIGLSNGDNYYAPVYLEWMLYALTTQDADFAYCNMVHSYLRWAPYTTRPEKGGMDLGAWIARAALVKSTPWRDTDNQADGTFVEAMLRKARRVTHVPGWLFVHNGLRPRPAG